VRLRETSPNVYRLDHDTDRHDDRCIAMALAILKLTTTPQGGGPMIFSDEVWAARQLAQARATGQLRPLVQQMGTIGGAPDWPMGALVRREEDDDQSLNGQTRPSPFV
jgi:hypothetical protein